MAVVSVGVDEISYMVFESDGSVSITYVLNRQSLQDVTINVENSDISTTPAGELTLDVFIA